MQIHVHEIQINKKRLESQYGQVDRCPMDCLADVKVTMIIWDEIREFISRDWDENLTQT